MEKRDINAALAPQPASAYSQAIEVTGGTRILFISGHIGTEPDGTTLSSMEEQARLAWRNLGAIGSGRHEFQPREGHDDYPGPS